MHYNSSSSDSPGALPVITTGSTAVCDGLSGCVLLRELRCDIPHVLCAAVMGRISFMLSPAVSPEQKGCLCPAEGSVGMSIRLMSPLLQKKKRAHFCSSAASLHSFAIKALNLQQQWDEPNPSKCQKYLAKDEEGAQDLRLSFGKMVCP